MKNITIQFTDKPDKSFLLKNSKLPGEIFDRKYQYDEILVAKVENQLVGFLVFDYLWYHIPFISFIWVESKYRKNGIGSALLTHLEKYLSANNHNVLFSSSEKTAIEAQAWHRRMGFEDSGEIIKINDDNIGELFFKKTIN